MTALRRATSFLVEVRRIREELDAMTEPADDERASAELVAVGLDVTDVLELRRRNPPDAGNCRAIRRSFTSVPCRRVESEAITKRPTSNPPSISVATRA